MELRYSPSLVIFWSVTYCGVLCQAQEILFNLKDPESNEVISLGQENVALVCHVTDVDNADITIRNADGDNIGNNMGVGNCLEHTLTSLTDADGGEYTCEITYSDNIDGMDRRLTKSLLLNVESGDQQCFRNGTSMQAFVEGETLKLSCYCTSTIRCNWIRTIEGEQLGFSIPVYETVEFGNDKRIIRVIIGPVTSEDIDDLRYDCYYGSLASERCSIGPSPVSGSDSVLNAVDPSTILRECPKPPATDQPVSQENPEAETTDPPVSKENTVIPPSGDDDGDGGLLLYIIIALVVLALMITLMLLLIFIALRRKRKVREQSREDSIEMPPPSNKNRAYDDSDATPPGRNMDGGCARGVPRVSSVSYGRRAPPDGMTHPDERRQMGETSHQRLSNALLVNHGKYHGGTPSGVPEYATVNARGQMAEVSQYGVLNAVIVGEEGDDDDEGFHRGEVTEYGVPVAFRADSHSDGQGRGEDYDIRTLPLKYS